MKLFYVFVFLAISDRALSNFFNDFVLRDKQNQIGRELAGSDGIDDALNFLKNPATIQKDGAQVQPSQPVVNKAESAFRKLKHRAEFHNESLILEDKDSDAKKNPTDISTTADKQTNAKSEVANNDSGSKTANPEVQAKENLSNPETHKPASSDCEEENKTDESNIAETPYGTVVSMIGGILVSENTIESGDGEADPDEKSGTPMLVSKMNRVKKAKMSSVITTALLLLLMQGLFWA